MSMLISKTGLALVAFLLLGGYLLWTEHQEHLAGFGRYWPLLLILLCPLMHVFMHRHGHGADGGHASSNVDADDKARSRPAPRNSEARDG